MLQFQTIIDVQVLSIKICFYTYIFMHYIVFGTKILFAINYRGISHGTKIFLLLEFFQECYIKILILLLLSVYFLSPALCATVAATFTTYEHNAMSPSLNPNNILLMVSFRFFLNSCAMNAPSQE